MTSLQHASGTALGGGFASGANMLFGVSLGKCSDFRLKGSSLIRGDSGFPLLAFLAFACFCFVVHFVLLFLFICVFVCLVCFSFCLFVWLVGCLILPRPNWATFKLSAEVGHRAVDRAGHALNVPRPSRPNRPNRPPCKVSVDWLGLISKPLVGLDLNPWFLHSDGKPPRTTKPPTHQLMGAEVLGTGKRAGDDHDDHLPAYQRANWRFPITGQFFGNVEAALHAHLQERLIVEPRLPPLQLEVAEFQVSPSNLGGRPEAGPTA